MLQLWQAFVGVKARRVEKYYQDLLASDGDSESKTNQQSLQSAENDGKTNSDFVHVPEKWKGQIEKVFTCDISPHCSYGVILSLQLHKTRSYQKSTIVACLCRICRGHFLVILLWMRMVEML